MGRMLRRTACSWGAAKAATASRSLLSQTSINVNLARGAAAVQPVRRSGFLAQKYEDWQSGSSEKQFKATLDRMLGFDKFDMNSFLVTLEDATKFAGVKGLK